MSSGLHLGEQTGQRHTLRDITASTPNPDIRRVEKYAILFRTCFVCRSSTGIAVLLISEF